MLAAGRHRLFVGVCFAACVVADMGDDLANNLPADLAPLLLLFGERVTMQFISQSTGWADHIILAVAPLGIITVIVCAIRVGGPTWLRAIIRRARESFAVVEAEVMSSTLHKVCELWNGQEVVRVMGEGLIREFIIMVPAGSDWDGNSATVETKDQDEYLNERGFTIQERIFGKLDIEEGIGHAGKDGLSVVIIRRKETEDNKEHETKDIAPNLTLNIHSRVGRGELYAVALFGILVQLGIVAYYACSTYYSPFRFHLLNKDDVIENYAFSCTAAGTMLIVAGMLICSLIVEKSTSEKRYLPISKANEARVVWLQRPGTVNDQTFESFAIYPESPQAVITTSRRASRTRSQGRETSSDKSWWECVSRWELNEVLILMGMFFSISGFIVQFVGLRAMHWTASVTLLGATILMTCLRVLVRRNLA
ncbi:hypothetical protein DER46DRAFT_696561 [Fusarium sp. MPI-SDFR-AT-0072]|nr:hypothetical protein DER46DRAFT_696561 [Fusarium sp. MPI-SDFR-AT-0072]